ARTAHHGHSFPVTNGSVAGSRNVLLIKLDVIADEQIKMSIAVVVEECATRAPANLFVVEAGFASHIADGAVSIVVEQDVVAPETAEEVIPAIVVVIADANTRLPACA